MTDFYGNPAACVKTQLVGFATKNQKTQANDCLPLLWDGKTCPGGLLADGSPEYAVCYGIPEPDEHFDVAKNDANSNTYYCGKDKKGKWRKKKCKKKQKKGKCHTKKARKKCKATCPSCSEKSESER